MYERGRPHTRQRLTRRVENFGSRLALIIIDFLATKSLLTPRARAGSTRPYAVRNGIPSAERSAIASSSVFAVVTIVTSIPRSLSMVS